MILNALPSKTSGGGAEYYSGTAEYQNPVTLTFSKSGFLRLFIGPEYISSSNFYSYSSSCIFIHSANGAALPGNFSALFGASGGYITFTATIQTLSWYAIFIPAS